MKIKWYGTASLLIEGGGTRILVDPYLKRYSKKLPPVPVEEAAAADTIFITHPHFDHFGDSFAFLSESVKSVYVAEIGIEHAQNSGVSTEKMRPLTAGQEIEIGEMKVRTYRSRHCKFDAGTILGVAFDPRFYLHVPTAIKILKAAKRYSMGKDDIFALEFTADGKTLMVLGSAGMDESESYPTGADLLVFPYQGRTRMHKYMIPFLEKFRPKAVTLSHFDNAFPPVTHTVKTKKFVPTAKKILPNVKAFVPKEGEWYEL